MFWTETPTQFENNFSGIVNPDRQDESQRKEIENLLQSISTGYQYNEFQEEKYRLLLNRISPKRISHFDSFFFIAPLLLISSINFINTIKH